MTINKGDTYYVITYNRGTDPDQLSSKIRWRVVDRDNQIVFAPTNIQEMLKILGGLHVDLDAMNNVVEHHLTLATNWHTSCLARVTGTFGDDYITICEERQEKLIANRGNLLEDLGKGKDVSTELNRLLFSGEVTKKAKLELVTEEKE